jgi:ribosomal protein S18 acetylase RimI-like enzyme
MTVLPWSGLPDLEEIAALYERSPERLVARAASWPASVVGHALLGPEGVVASALRVDASDSLALVQLVRHPDLPPERALPLVDWGEEQALALGLGGLRVSLLGAPGMGPLLAQRGYALTERFLRLVLQAEPIRAGALPAGVVRASMEELGLQRVLAMSNAAFRGVPGSMDMSVEDWRSMVASPGYSDELLCLLAEAGEPVGLARCCVVDRTGTLEALALAEGARGRGLGRWLLRWSTAALLGAGCTEIDLWVAESNAGARRLYEAGGFVVVQARESWERSFGAR